MMAQRLINAVNYILSSLKIDKTSLVGQQHAESDDSKVTTESDKNTSSSLLDKNQPVERLFIWLQRVIYWHEPLKSLITICSVLTSFLLFSLYEPRFYPCLIIGIFIYNLGIFWFQHIWSEIRVSPRIEDELNRWTDLHPHIKTIKELQLNAQSFKQHSTDSIAKLVEMRAQNPVKFCSICCLVFAITGSIGRKISGLNLILLLGLYLYAYPKVKKHTRFLNSFDFFRPFLSFNAQFMTKSTLRDSHPLRKISEASARRLSTIDPMTPIIEEDVTPSPMVHSRLGINLLADDRKVVDHPLSKQMEGKASKENSPDRFIRQSLDKSNTQTIQQQKQQQQQNSSASSSSSQLCSDDGSLIDLDEDQHDDFVIL